jgi:peptidyl-prolyl cis-trans isomerase SurA
MIRKIGILFFCLSWFLNVSASGDDVLFRIEDTDVKVSEFEYIYKKNNFNNKADYSEASLKEYLDLYINFRLKVKEAEAEGLDKDVKLMSELKVYQEQLYNSFYDREVLKVLVDEVSERVKNDVSISHIYTNSSKNTDAEKMINEAYAALERGVSFEDAAKKFSDDTYTKENGGALGFYTALQISFYDLENAAYNTPVGKYSQPVKTSIGYHIIKVNEKRPALGKVKVAIIKLTKNELQDNTQLSEKINAIYKEILNGKSFETSVAVYSEDVNTKDKQGELPWFGISQYDPVFEKNAFSLAKIGDISKPFETTSGWYIIKLLDKKLPQDIIAEKDELVTEIKKSERYKIQRQKHIDEIIKKHGYTLAQPDFDLFKSKIIAANKANTKFEEITKPKTLLTIGKNYTVSDSEFQEFIANNAYRYKSSSEEEKFDKLFQSYLEAKVNDFHIIEYGVENPEYGALLKEYRDGILLFDLMEKNVWSKAVQDSIGLRNFFEAHKDNYKIPEKANINKFVVKDLKTANFLVKTLQLDPKLEQSKNVLKLEKKKIITKPEIIIAEKGDDLSKSIDWKVGGLKAIAHDGKYAVYQTTEIIPEKEREFKDAKGFAIAGFQEFLEKQWILELKQKFQVDINQKVLQGMIK